LLFNSPYHLIRLLRECV